MNNLTPAVAIAPSPEQFNKLEKSNYNHIVDAFQQEKRINLPNAILSSIDSLQEQINIQSSYRNQQNIIAIIGLIFIFFRFVTWIINFRKKP